MPANFHPDISKTVACGRWRKTGGQKKIKLDGGKAPGRGKVTGSSKSLDSNVCHELVPLAGC